MNFIIISSFLIFSVIFFFALQRTKSIEAKREQEYWEREFRANSTRKKSLDDLNYIIIPDVLLNMSPENTNEEINGYISELNDLSQTTIVNLTGFSNTDLKLKYGTANITVLTEYDINYTYLVTLLQKLAEKLYEENNPQLAIKVLEFAISTNTDVSKTYYLLAQLYNETGTPEKISSLIKQANNLNSLLKNTIVQTLKASGQ